MRYQLKLHAYAILVDINKNIPTSYKQKIIFFKLKTLTQINKRANSNKFAMWKQK